MNKPHQDIESIGPNSEKWDSGPAVDENIKHLSLLFPSTVADGKVDFAVLRQLLGDLVDEGDERYGLNWKGKARSRALALTPTLATLRPSMKDSEDWKKTKNILIEGENLEVLKCLRKSYAGQVKLIYIDPPYNTGNNLIYKNDFTVANSDYSKATGETDESGTRFTTIKKGSGRFHTDWLNSFYPTLLAAREFLSEDGVLVITIDENELHNVITVCEEIFPKGGYDIDIVAVVHNPRGVQGKNFSYTHEYAVFVYRHNLKVIADKKIEDSEVDWAPLRNWGGESERSDAKNCFYPVLVKEGQIIGFGEVTADHIHPPQTEVIDSVSHVYPIDRNGVERKWRYARQSVEAILSMLRAKRIQTGYDIELGKTFGLHKSVWRESRYDANGYGTSILKQLVPDSPFDFPKSLWAVYDVVEAVIGGDDSAIVMDFYAGSGTTGHAVLELNAATGANHRYILVQIPEPVTGHERFSTIADLTMERLRCAGKSLEDKLYGSTIDTGFRVYKLDSSNLKPWQPTGDLKADLFAAVDNVLPDRSEDDLLVELLLKTGIDLTLPDQTRQISGRTVHALGGGALMVCLSDVTEADAEALGQGMADWRTELDPPGQTTFYFKDSGFENACAKANLAAILRQRLGKAIAKLASL